MNARDSDQGTTLPETVDLAKHAPLPLERRESTTGLTPVAERAVKDLSLNRPQVSSPGHWSSREGDLQISTAVLKYALTRIDTPLRALISFDPGDMEAKRTQLLNQALPNRAQMNPQQIKRSWGKTLKIRTQARQQRVEDILSQLTDQGVTLDPDTVQVHRVSNTFYATVTLHTLRRIQQLQATGGSFSIRKVRVEEVAAPVLATPQRHRLATIE